MKLMSSLLESHPASDSIDGLYYLPGYLSEDDATHLLTTINAQNWLTELQRRVQHYGYKYDYTRRQIDLSLYLGPLPAWVAPLAQRLHGDDLIESVPDQLIINEYEPGQGISAHVDCVPCFGPTILSLSLGSPCQMDFLHTETEATFSLLVEPNSLLVMKRDARYIWRHAIPARKSDRINGASVKRARRVSLTFRTVLLTQTNGDD